MKTFDISIIGGGFYGSVLAYYVKRRFSNLSVVLIEKESDLLTRASAKNQARVHNGFHYPRSVVTAYRSRINFERFINEFYDAIDWNFRHMYAIPYLGSKITPESFEQFCKSVGLKYTTSRDAKHSLFNPRNIAAVYDVTEPVFNYEVLREIVKKNLISENVEVLYDCSVKTVEKETADCISILCNQHGQELNIKSKLVLNATYANLADVRSSLQTKLRYELAEISYVKVPSEWENKGFTIIDGPFCSSIPYPVKNLHSLTHVRHTPHTSWSKPRQLKSIKNLDINSYSSSKAMIRDTIKYVPGYEKAKYVISDFEVKVVLKKNDLNDGRPILFERDYMIENLYHVLGGKIDNVYDIIELLNNIIEDKII